MTCFFKHARFVSAVWILVVFFTYNPLSLSAQQTVVYGVFFYSPTCGHCHEVIENHWPGIQNEFGDRLQVLFIDVTTREGSQIMQTTIDAMNIPSRGVPMLVIGDTVLIGSVDIPQRAPALIRAGLVSGGITYPPIPDIEPLFEQALSQVTQSDAGILDDPANLLALVILAGLIGNLIMVSVRVWNGLQENDAPQSIWQVKTPLLMMGALIGIVLTGSLAIGSFNDGLTLVLSLIVMVIFLMLAYNLWTQSPARITSGWSVPAILAAGLLVAAYLAYVETTLSEATCGAIGNCNAVQQSTYAYIFGIPIGVIGVLGYLALLVIWLYNRYEARQSLRWLFFGFTVIGVVFSIYLTFLEPFVIGVSCVWCLTSAVVMTMLLWLSIPVENGDMRRTEFTGRLAQ